MNEASADKVLQARVEAARQRSLAWLWSMQAGRAATGVLRISAAHDAATWPGVLLYGTYNGVMCLDLLGGLDRLGAPERAALVGWLEDHRGPDGMFAVPGMRPQDTFKKPDAGETWRYIGFHLTNYALGAIEALDPGRAPLLDFARPYLDPKELKAWLAERDLRDPWQEGNNIVNLASFLLLIQKFGDAGDRRAVATAFDILFAWHDRLQEPATGFWGVGQNNPHQRLQAFAGAMHNYHLWYARGRSLPHQHRGVDYVLGRAPTVTSACIDVDEVDLLVHAARCIDHRRRDIDAWLKAKLAALLDFQNEDGGFADEREGVRRQDGWVKGYAEPQGVSNTFAAWFRWIAIAMAADRLWPGLMRWRFRPMIGIGYRMPDQP